MNSEDVVLIKIVCPSDRLSLYNKITVLFTKYGEDTLKDCKASCDKHNKNIINCFNMFIAASIAYQKEDYKKADLLYKYIESQLNLIYSDTEIYKEEVIDLDNWEENNQDSFTGDVTEYNNNNQED